MRNDVLLVRYRYHWNGLRAEKETFGPDATVVRYQYDGPWLQAETNVIGNTLVRYSRGADGRVLAAQRNQHVRYFLTDALGTPTSLLDAQGHIVARFRYDAWGNQIAHDGSENTPIRHTGHYFDEETGLYYVAARYYDPDLGGFISEDPAPGEPERPITFNPYVAFNANPTTYVDPDGRQALPYASAAESLALAQMGRTPEERRELLGVYNEAQTRTMWQTLPIVATSYIGLGLGSAARAGWAAYRSGGVGWGIAVGSARAVPYLEAGAALGADVPGPGLAPVPMPSGPAAAARAEAVMAQEAPPQRHRMRMMRPTFLVRRWTYPSRRSCNPRRHRPGWTMHQPFRPRIRGPSWKVPASIRGSFPIPRRVLSARPAHPAARCHWRPGRTAS